MQTILTTTGINVANLPLSSRGQNKTKQNKTKTKDKRTNEQIDSGSLWSELLSTTIFVLTVNSTLDQFLYRWKTKDIRKAVK